MKVKAVALAAMVATTLVPGVLQAEELPNAPHVMTTGQATVEAIPDIAILSIEVNVASKHAAAAKQMADERVARYFDLLQKNGIEKKDINAANLRTQPEYDYSKEGKSLLKGYRAIRQMQVTLRQLNKLNEVLDDALKSGLDEIRSVELGVAKPEDYRDRARETAIENATRQATALAKGFNSQLGAVWSIRYHMSNYQPMPLARVYKASASTPLTSSAQTYEQQTIHFDDQVEVVFEMLR